MISGGAMKLDVVHAFSILSLDPCPVVIGCVHSSCSLRCRNSKSRLVYSFLRSDVLRRPSFRLDSRLIAKQLSSILHRRLLPDADLTTGLLGDFGGKQKASNRTTVITSGS